MFRYGNVSITVSMSNLQFVCFPCLRGGGVAGGGEARMTSVSILEKFDLEFCNFQNARVPKDDA